MYAADEDEEEDIGKEEEDVLLPKGDVDCLPATTIGAGTIIDA